MTTRADRAIAALRSGYDDLARRATDLTLEQLEAPSGAEKWPVAQVLSHLGSSAEINRPVIEAVREDEPRPDVDPKLIWARWDAMAPKEQADAFIESYRGLVEAYEQLDSDQRADLRIDLGFLPEPVEVAIAAAFVLHEQALHGWDVAVATDPAAALPTDAAELMLDVTPFLLGFIGKSREVLGDDRRVALAVELTDLDRTIRLDLGDAVTLADAESATEPDAVLRLPVESWLRLVSGRLGVDHTPAGVEVTGAVTLGELRRIFPGY